jgi:hypothetical protein
MVHRVIEGATMTIRLEKQITRADRFLALLRSKRGRGKPPGVSDWPEGFGWVSLPEVLSEDRSRHGDRVLELKNSGQKIENATRSQTNGEMWSCHRLTYDAELDLAWTRPNSQRETFVPDLGLEHDYDG